MQKDSRTGRGHWRGCHSFQNIICDGDSLNATESRDGGLKMGGKYWYYVWPLPHTVVVNYSVPRLILRCPVST